MVVLAFRAHPGHILAFRANAAAGAGPSEANAAVVLMIASIKAGVIGIPLAVSVPHAVQTMRTGEPMELMEMQTQAQT